MYGDSGNGSRWCLTVVGASARFRRVVVIWRRRWRRLWPHVSGYFFVIFDDFSINSSDFGLTNNSKRLSPSVTYRSCWLLSFFADFNSLETVLHISSCIRVIPHVLWRCSWLVWWQKRHPACRKPAAATTKVLSCRPGLIWSTSGKVDCVIAHTVQLLV